MTPIVNLLFRHYNNYGAIYFSNSSLIVPLLMAEEKSTKNSSKKPVEKEQEQKQEQEKETTTASREAAGWLQLGLASSSSAAAERGELQLFPERPPPKPAPSTAASTSYGIGLQAAAAEDLRVVDRPQRARVGIWIALRPAENQVNEPFLPQLPKSYLRIKDVRMTIRLLMRYLANKLDLQDESQVEITCRSQQLMPFATLEEVRDHIWFVRDADAPGPSSPATDHVMKLYYSRRA